MDFKTLIGPVGIVRILEVIFTCISFGLVASVGHSTLSLWIWCMFSWGFCFCVTFLILILEVASLSAKLPISWRDFTTAFAMLACLMVFASSVIYATLFTCSVCGRQIGASVISFLAFILYATEVGLTRAKSDEISGFLSTVPGLLKILETFVALIIFICLGHLNIHLFPGLQWCVAVYSICFIFTLTVIILTIGRLLNLIPAFHKILICCNMLAALMYTTAVVTWPFYSLRGNPRICLPGFLCLWDNLVVISFMSCVNLIAYFVDTVYSFRLVFVFNRS